MSLIGSPTELSATDEDSAELAEGFLVDNQDEERRKIDLYRGLKSDGKPRKMEKAQAEAYEKADKLDALRLAKPKIDKPEAYN